MGKKKPKEKKGEEKEPVTPPVAEAKQETATTEAPFKYDEFWLAKGKESVESSIPSLQKRIQLFYNFLNTLSASTLVGSVVLLTLTGTKNLRVFVLVFLAILVLQAAKFTISIWITKPKYQDLDLRSPIQINNAHNSIVASLKSNLFVGKITVLIASVLYIVFVGAALYYNNIIEKIKTQNPSITVLKDQVQLEGTFDKDTEALLMLTGEKLVMKLSDSSKLEDGKLDSIKVKDTIMIPFKALKNRPLNYHYHVQNPNFKLKKAAFYYTQDSIRKMLEKPYKP